MSDIARYIAAALVTILIIFMIFTTPYLIVMAILVASVALFAFFLRNVIDAALVDIQNFISRKKKNDE